MINLNASLTSLSNVHPIKFIMIYLLAIPVFGALYTFATPQGFYAPYARYEPYAVKDRNEITAIIVSALRRSFEERSDQNFIIDKWKIDPKSVRVADVKSTDGSHLSFMVKLSADGIGEFAGAKSVGWPLVVTVSERPDIFTLFSDRDTFYRSPEIDFTKHASPIKKLESEKLFLLVFGQSEKYVGAKSPSLAFNIQEEEKFEKYLRGIKGDASAISGHFWRMIYLSSVVITTLGLGDIIPITASARVLVAFESVMGVVFVGLFLNALATKASLARQDILSTNTKNENLSSNKEDTPA
jgi:hypothetical protein